ncbi:MAG: hypothetical protein IJJ14_06910, partial [Coriobacteriales bacterium]|nr:hypothetical protein [Coriobacteriales bacterium]
DFFQHAGELYPRAYTRLYTNGDLATPELLERLAAAGLKEIRFSVKRDPGFEDSNDADIIRRIEQAKRCIPHVMVEMPVMPGDLEGMQQLLLGLDGAGCDGINLLELCFPLHNWDEFARRGFEVKNPPFRIPYHYEYAGGLPIDGSESVCLDLLRFAQEAGLRMGVHYCSLENKFTSQINLQNLPYRAPSGRCDLDPTCRFDDDDFFFKTLLLFGRDAIAAAAALEAADAPARAYRLTMASVNSPETCLEADPALAPIITNALPQARCGISLRVVEDSPAGLRIRELAVRPLL